MILRKLNALMSPEPAPAAAPAPAAPPQGTPAPTPAPTAAPAPAATPPPAPAPTALTSPAPDEFKVTWPEGFTLDEKRSTAFVDLAKKHGLKSDQAQDLVNFYVEGEKAREAAQVQMITKWAEEAKSDQEIGGANWDKNLGIARQALDRVGSPALKELLATTGLGNHKEVIKLFAKIGSAISEDKLPGGKSGSAPVEPTLDQMMQDAFPASPGMFEQK